MQNSGDAIQIETYDNIASVEAFRLNMRMIAATHRPAMVPFFMRLAGLPSTAALNPDLLGRIHLTYQAAMHATRATRAMVYFLPHLDSPELRQRKLQIYNADKARPLVHRRIAVRRLEAGVDGRVRRSCPAGPRGTLFHGGLCRFG